MDRTSWKPKIYKATEAVDYKANENLEDLEISGSDFSITHGGTVVSCNSCSKTWFVGQYPRSNVNNTEREINSHGDAHAPLDSLFNISGKSGSSDGSCKQCGAIPDNEDYVGHLKQHGTDYIGESKANETQYGTLNPDGSVTNKMDLDDSNSDDPIAYNFGFFEGKSGKPMDDYDDLAPEYVRGYNDGKKSIGESKANEDDHKKSWGELDSIAKKGFSDIGYDQQSWDSEPEEVRAEMETVVKDNMSQENWKEVANKIYKEELNKGKKSGGESSYENWIDELDPIEIIMDNFDPDNKDGSVKCDHCGYELIHDGSIMSTNIQREAKDHMINNHINELESNASSTTSESKASEFSASDDLKLKCPACGFKELIGSWLANWTIKPNQTSYESKASEEDPCWKGYKQIGMKDKNGKQVPNCVPNTSGNEYSLPSMFKKKKSNFHNTSFKDYAKVFEEPIESKWERKKHVLGGDFYDFFRLEWNSVPSEIQDIFRATVSVESKADEFTDWGSWAEDETGVGSKMSQHDQIAMMKDLGIADKTLRNMGYNLQKDGVEGFIDRIEKELSKFGINLDKPEEQED